MSVDYQSLRIEGVYKQNEDGNLMLRVKIPAGVLSAEQALAVCSISERFSNSVLHITTRGCLEIHWLQYEDLPIVQRMMASVGLTSRGACGGAVRGITCSTTFSDGFAVAQVIASKLARHFTGNPHFESLPKKFKVGVDAGYEGARHLIQDFGLVYVGSEEGKNYYDVWTAGGLGRQPQEAFLFEAKVPEERIIPIIEAIAKVYEENTPKGKRLKHLLLDIGETDFRQLVEGKLEESSPLKLMDGFEKRLTALPLGEDPTRVEAVIFAGEIQTKELRNLAAIATDCAGGYLVLTTDQNVAFIVSDESDANKARSTLADAGFNKEGLKNTVPFRVCPGSHECRLGLAKTRDVASQVLEALGENGPSLSWAISGCPNSCAQPQLAEAGILVSKLVKDEEGSRHPLFDLLRREGEGFGRPVRQGLSLDELLEEVSALR